MTRIDRFRQAASSGAISPAASTTCSKLSSISSSARSPTASCTASLSGWSARSGTFSAWAMAGSTSAGSRSGASATNTTPSPKSDFNASATARATRVLPTPPGPVRVSKGTPGSRSSPQISARTSSRPISGVRVTGSDVTCPERGGASMAPFYRWLDENSMISPLPRAPYTDDAIGTP